jgi:hypothetical protein
MFENKPYRPWKIFAESVRLSYRGIPRVLRRGRSIESVGSVRSVRLFGVWDRVCLSWLIMEVIMERHPLPYTLKHPTDFTDLTDHAETPRRGTYRNLIVCKPYRPRGNFPRSVRLFRLKFAYFTVICYVINNRCIIIIKYAVGQLDRPREIPVESAKSAKSAMFLRGFRGPGFSMISLMIGHGGQTPSQTLKHFATFATSSTSAKALRRRTNRNSITSKLDNPRGSTASRNPWNSTSSKLCNLRGDLPRVAKLFRLNNAYSTVICYVLNNTCIGLGVLV